MHSPDVLSPQSLASSGHYQPQLYPASPYHGHQNQSDSYAGVHPNPMPVQSPKRHPRSSYNDFADFENRYRRCLSFRASLLIPIIINSSFDRGSIENPRTSYRSKPQESQLRSERELHALREELAHEKHKNAQQLRESINSVHPDMEILQRRIQVLENKVSRVDEIIMGMSSRHIDLMCFCRIIILPSTLPPLLLQKPPRLLRSCFRNKIIPARRIHPTFYDRV